MAEDPLNEDQWLYGDGDGSQGPPGVTDPKEPALALPDPPGVDPPGVDPPAGEFTADVLPPGEEPDPPDTQPTAETEQAAAEKPLKPPGEELEEGEDDEDSDDSDDNVQVTIGDIKTTAAQYGNLNVKRNVMLSSGIEKHKQAGKFSIDEFESIGTINGVAAHEYSIDALEDKPWRKPGADITDYFNYGFNEETWRAYCERQKSMRIHESGAGLGALGMARLSHIVSLTDKYQQPPPQPPNNGISSSSNNIVRKAGPPGPRRTGVIDVIGSSTVASRRTNESPSKEMQVHPNNIQVMSGSRKISYDMSVPPPPFDSGTMPPVVSYSSYGAGDFYPPEMDPYYQSYDRPPPSMSWSQDKSVPKEIMVGDVVIKQEPPDKPPKERERERDRERHKDSRHRHRSRSRSMERRSRKHKSRSRSPSHRSHKKKKSKKSERERSRDRDRSRDRERSRERERSRDHERSRERERSREPSE